MIGAPTTRDHVGLLTTGGGKGKRTMAKGVKSGGSKKMYGSNRSGKAGKIVGGAGQKLCTPREGKKG